MDNLPLSKKVVISFHSGNDESSGEDLDAYSELNSKHLNTLFMMLRQLVAWDHNTTLETLTVYTDCWIPYNPSRFTVSFLLVCLLLCTH